MAVGGDCGAKETCGGHHGTSRVATRAWIILDYMETPVNSHSFHPQCLSQGHTIYKAEHRLWPGHGTVLEHLARLIGFGVKSSSGYGLSVGGYLE